MVPALRLRGPSDTFAVAKGILSTCFYLLQKFGFLLYQFIFRESSGLFSRLLISCVITPSDYREDGR